MVKGSKITAEEIIKEFDSAKSSYKEISLNKDDWENNSQEITIEGITPATNGFTFFPNDITDEQHNAGFSASIYIVAQKEDAIVFGCKEKVPEIDIPIGIIILY